jgi:hypothetical protein
MEHNVYCVGCSKMVIIIDPFRIKIRNRKSKSGGVEAHKGNCPHCKASVYKIIGH